MTGPERAKASRAAGEGDSDRGAHGAGAQARTGADARFAYDGLDRTIHEKARLGIMTSLVANPKGLAFGDLKRLCALTDGNLARHLQVLQDAGLVEVTKGFDNKRPLTTCRLTAAGWTRFLSYLETLEQVVRDAAASSRDVAAVPDPKTA